MGGRVTIIGAGWYGREIALIAKACGLTIELRDDDAAQGFRPTGTPLWHPYVIGIAGRADRQRLARSLDGSAADPLVHPTARLDPGCVLSPGVVVGAGAVLGAGVILGRHAHVRAGARLGPGRRIADYADVSCSSANVVIVAQAPASSTSTESV